VRLPPQPGERLDRAQRLTFTFEDKPQEGFAGDTIGSALFASGRRVFSRSFKYHRPRGLLCCTGNCPNCLMEVDGVPNVRVCTEPLQEGARVRAQNVVGSLEFDVLRVVDKLGGPFTPVGFYYKTMIRPRRAWPLYERFLRNVAGLGRVDPNAGHTTRYDVEHRSVDVLVVGGGEAGAEAAASAAAAGQSVVVVDTMPRPPGQGYEVIQGTALGAYEDGLVPVAARTILYRFRADRLVVAAGSVDQPLVFPGNDLTGVMLPSAIGRLVDDWALLPGERAVVVTADDRGLEAADALRRAGTEVVRVTDLRETQVDELSASGRSGLLRRVTVDGEQLDCDVLVMSGGAQPAYSLLAQAGARIEYDAARGVFVPRELPARVEAVGTVAEPEPAAIPRPSYAGDGKCFVCVCEDVTTKDLRHALAEGFESIELAKRYTTVTMGPCQGKLCQLASVRYYASLQKADEEAIGTTTARPPWQPVTLGLLAGRGHEPAKRTSIHHRHEALGARTMWTGRWRRPHSYGDPADEVRAVHESIGVIDVSTLGKLLVEGPDAVAFLERLYPNRFADLAVGRVRYAVLGTDGARIMDDGTVVRLADTSFYITTTSTGAETVLEWFEWWNAVWKLDVHVTDLTGAVAAINVAGPRTRDLLGPLTEADLGAAAFRYLDAKRGRVAGVAALLLRIGFVGELGYELHFAAPYGDHVWDAIVAAGARPFGLEAQRILRLEKQHILVGQDTDSESNVLAAGMPWLVKLDKEDFVGRAALEHAQERGARERLVGFEVDSGAVPLEGAQIVVAGKPQGRVTSARRSEAAGRAIGMAWVPAELAEEGAAIRIKVDGRLEAAAVRLRPFYDPNGERLRS
jgi:sarcosine oxidase subunit alpha